MYRYPLNIQTFIISLALQVGQLLAGSYTGHYAIEQFTFRSSAIRRPSSLNELQHIIGQAIKENAPIALVGTDKSMGGQTTSNQKNAYRISLEKLNKLISLDISKQEVTVQAGMTWRDLQILIAPHGLAVRAMQSYHDFSIGGSLSVNVHGQDLHDAPIIKTVISFKLLCADGNVRTVSRTENAELFNLAIGGYGLFGIILEVTLSLTRDTMMHRNIATIPAQEFPHFFAQHILNNPHVSFYSARFSVGSSNLFKNALVIYYTDSNTLSSTPFKPFSLYQGYVSKSLLTLTKMSRVLKNWRFFFESKFLKQPTVISRNNFLNEATHSLPQYGTYILQEYFIPYDTLTAFIKHMKQTFSAYKVNIINVSARHVPADTESILSYAPQDRCALVLYINIPENNAGYIKCAKWTNTLINQALECKGSYYLPYHILGTDEQLLKAYPNMPYFLKLKQKYDPHERFSNRLYERYKHLA